MFAIIIFYNQSCSFNTRTYNLTLQHGSNLPGYCKPMTTPQYQHQPMTTPAMLQQPIPFSQDTVKVTPGLFGNRPIPDDTPDHFIGMYDYYKFCYLQSVWFTTKLYGQTVAQNCNKSCC